MSSSVPLPELPFQVTWSRMASRVGNLPKFEDLPARKGDPAFSAWGVWGSDDEIGTLNLLTPDAVRQAGSEIKEGLRLSLNWSLHAPYTPSFGRHEFIFEQKIHRPGPLLVLEDTLVMNSQKSSQWDGHRHFAYQKEQLFYNGIKPEEILEHGSGKLGLQNWHEKGAIAGRGVLIDYWSYAMDTGKTYDPCERYPILFDDLMKCLEYQASQPRQSLVVRPGDIIVIRCGYTQKYMGLDHATEKKIGQTMPPATCGVAQDLQLLKWLWDNHVAAVGGDSPAWECFMPDENAPFSFHEVLIAGWGCPIAEMLWLEDLAQACKTRGRWSFFLTSAPLNVHGGVASPANMLAIL